MKEGIIMQTNINDNRTNDTALKEIFTYSNEEKETVLTFDYKNNEWKVFTNVPGHITKLLKLKDHNLQVETVNETGTITSIKGTLAAKNISFRNIKELTEEQKDVIRNRFNK